MVVSILFFVDVALKAYCTNHHMREDCVSILVFVDVALKDIPFYTVYYYYTEVSILVFVDVALKG